MTKPQPQRFQRKLQAAYRDDGQTFRYLARTQHASRDLLVRQVFSQSLVPKRRHRPRSVVVVIDVHFFSRHFGIAVQLCHFHQLQAGIRYLGLYPKSEAAKDLLRLYRRIGSLESNELASWLAVWAMEYDDLLTERTIHPSGRWSYTHRRLRSAWLSLKRNVPYLYTYKEHPNLPIPNTTNPLDGGTFSPMESMLKTHRGLSLPHQNSLVLSFLRRNSR